MKKTVCLIFALIICFGFAGCKKEAQTAAVTEPKEDRLLFNKITNEANKIYLKKVFADDFEAEYQKVKLSEDIAEIEKSLIEDEKICEQCKKENILIDRDSVLKTAQAEFDALYKDDSLKGYYEALNEALKKFGVTLEDYKALTCAEAYYKYNKLAYDNKNNTSNSSNQDDEEPLLSVLKNQKPFINQKGESVYLKNYKLIYKYPDDFNVEFSENPDIFAVNQYTLVDLDNDGKKELIAVDGNFGDSYLILREENGNIYGYGLYIRWFEMLKQDGTFVGSNGATSNDYNHISFSKTEYTITPFAKFDFTPDETKPSSNKYGFEPDMRFSKFEINGKSVSLEEIEKFSDEWDKRPDARWVEFN